MRRYHYKVRYRNDNVVDLHFDGEVVRQVVVAASHQEARTVAAELNQAVQLGKEEAAMSMRSVNRREDERMN